MSEEKAFTSAPDPNWKWMYRAGGVSALVLGMSYIIIVALYAYTGAPAPSDGEAWLRDAAGKATVWWAILGLSVLTDLLFLPMALALYHALKRVNRNAMLLATAFVGLFVVVDLAVTWPNYASLITLSHDFAAATADVQRTAYLTAANSPSEVLTSSFFGVYAILVPSLGILVAALVMLLGTFSRSPGVFRRSTAYVGMLTGVFGTVSVIGALFWNPLGAAAILTSVLTTVWAFLVGSRLYSLGQQ